MVHFLKLQLLKTNKFQIYEVIIIQKKALFFLMDFSNCQKITFNVKCNIKFNMILLKAAIKLPSKRNLYCFMDILLLLYNIKYILPISGINPCCLLTMMVNKVNFPIKISCHIPAQRQRNFSMISFLWHD